MWAVSPPTVGVEEVARRSAGRIRDKEFASRVREAIPGLLQNHRGLQRVLTASVGHEIDPTDFAVAGLTNKEMVWLYDRQLSRARGAARGCYDDLLASAHHQLCSYCQYGQATTLDHFFPKQWVSGLAVEPWNLVPACQQCNRKLLDFHAETAAEAMFHPYHEGVSDRWLYAELLENDPPALRFEARPPTGLDPQTKARVGQQFGTTLALHLMYSAVSARDIAEAKASLSHLMHPGLPGGEQLPPPDVETVRQSLQETAEAAFLVDSNSRRGAAYEAMAASDWFCSDGYRVPLGSLPDSTVIP